MCNIEVVIHRRHQTNISRVLKRKLNLIEIKMKMQINCRICVSVCQLVVVYLLYGLYLHVMSQSSE